VNSSVAQNKKIVSNRRITGRRGLFYRRRSILSRTCVEMATTNYIDRASYIHVHRHLLTFTGSRVDKATSAEITFTFTETSTRTHDIPWMIKTITSRRRWHRDKRQYNSRAH